MTTACDTCARLVAERNYGAFASHTVNVADQAKRQALADGKRMSEAVAAERATWQAHADNWSTDARHL